MVEKGVNKLAYDWLKILIKFNIYFSSCFYVISILLSYLGIDSIFIDMISYVSILTILVYYTASYAFRFCYYHRLPLYYMLLANIVNFIMYSLNINKFVEEVSCILMLLYVLVIIVILTLKFKNKILK